MTASSSLADMLSKLKAPRSIWVMLPAGKITHDTIMDLADHMEKGDTVIDGGNSFYKDDIRRAQELQKKELHYIDVGTSGGVWGLDRGYCMMIGGDDEAVGPHRPDPQGAGAGPVGNIDKSPSRPRASFNHTAEEGYLHCGPAGSGHFVKMVHNGIEYGIMQAYAEGFDIMKNKSSEAIAGGHALRPTPGRHRRSLAARQRRGIMVAGPHRDRPGGERDAVEVRRQRLRFRRGPLDHRGGDRGGRAGGSAVRRALRAVPLAAGRIRSAKNFFRRCATSSAGTSS